MNARYFCRKRYAYLFLCLFLSACIHHPPASHPSNKLETFVAFDVETTGFSARSERIIELGAVKFQRTGILEARSWLIKPDKPIPARVTRIHGITDAMVTNQPTFPVAFRSFCRFAQDCDLVAHNARFDVRFIRAEAKRHHVSVPRLRVLDTLPLARKWFPGHTSYALERLVKALHIPSKGFHRAEADAHYTALLFLKGLEASGTSLSPFEDIPQKAQTWLREHQ